MGALREDIHRLIVQKRALVATKKRVKRQVIKKSFPNSMKTEINVETFQSSLLLHYNITEKK